MQLRFGHFLFAASLVTLACLSVAITTVVQIALNEAPGFSASMLRQGEWLEVVDFLDQVPPQKLAYIFLTHNPGHVLLALLAALNAMLVGGWALQNLLFRSCTAVEIKAARDDTLQFLIFRAMFLGTILETSVRSRGDANSAVPTDAAAPAASVPGAGSLREVCIWLAWFCTVAFLRWFIVLLRERFASAQASPHSTVRTFTKYLIVMIGFSLLNLIVGAVVLAVFNLHTTWTVLSLLLFENVVLIPLSIRLIVKYVLYIRTLQKEQPWEERGSTLYYVDMACEIMAQLLTFAHLMHIWSHYGLSFSLIDLFLFLHVKQLLTGVWRNLKSIRTYSKAIWELNARFPDATPEELRAVDDVCSICRDTMEQAKKLPCGHYFHRTCLIQWIEFQSFCPSCRAPLIPSSSAAAAAAAAPNPNARAPIPANVIAGMPPGVAAAVIAHQQAAMAQFAHQHQQRQAQQAAALAAAAAAAGAPPNQGGGGGGGFSPASGSGGGLHDTGLRHRGHRGGDSSVLSNSPSAGGAAASSSGAIHPSHAASAHSHSHHAHGPSHGHMHAHGPPVVTQPVFRIDTSRFSWLPNFSLEVQTVREGVPPTTADLASHQAPATQGAQVDDSDLPPPLEPIPAASGSSVQPAAVDALPFAAMSIEEHKVPEDSAAAASSTTASTPSAASSSMSLREQIYLATQRRLEQNATPRDSTAVATEESVAMDTESAPAFFANAASGAPAFFASAASSSDSAPSALPADAMMVEESPLLAGSTSPLLLSQDEADANLARQLQMEENEAAAEEQRNGGGFARFFSL